MNFDVTLAGAIGMTWLAAGLAPAASADEGSPRLELAVAPRLDDARKPAGE